MNKTQRHLTIRDRAARAITNLYHNADSSDLYRVKTHGQDDDSVQAWFDDAASYEISYLNDGGPYGSNYPKTLRADCNAGRFKSEAARRFYINSKLREMRLDQERNPWEKITQFGKLYTWGRSSATLAPADLVRSRGGSGFSMRTDYCDEIPMERVVEVIQIVEAFNAFVARWNSRENLQAMFDDANLADVDEAADLELCTD